ncbi:sporulation protein YabP [Clostridium algidicarnis]|uniref:Sporulation protein YabP n=2 Tax=Clostridium algidicarnis TaxID=37659 RepID=A0A2S6FZ75_9CLOT|nr:sporulation protein YabP [Clostridium algidicarnis]MBB6630128.1 sporulation protein YabP [Clostridium algidicarnis]MBB6696868.1 sporulation protein YabP [Clostridium algidicarnis]MBU3193217.1 sporulation protein YabP [Clostridium algidicarnis]MBU3204573.1 sporulation protein YabP [Clostridium algidicarnis]MBU3206527.1 sporulation protein YabP [Clostridium algidicarnis]
MENKKDTKGEDKKSNLTLDNRKRLFLTGVIEVFNFNEETISLNTSIGVLNIRGKNLKMNKLDVQNGEVIVGGTIDSFVYSTLEAKRVNTDSIIKRLFK